jgi:hypothetical protein
MKLKTKKYLLVISILESLSIKYRLSPEGILFTKRLHLHGQKVCLAPCRSFPLVLLGQLHTKMYQRQKITEGKAFNLTLRYVEGVPLINNPLMDSINPPHRS